MKPVLVLGGYGNFGKRVVELLARQGIQVEVGGRDRQKAEEFVASLAPHRADIAVFDIRRDLGAKLDELQPAVVINTCGPFQNLDYSTAQACIDRGIPYVDLADARDYVTGIKALDAAAKKHDTVVISGASTVPGLSSAVVEHFLGDFARIEELDFGIAPGQRAERGLATTQAILGYVGKRLEPCAGYERRYGWQDIHIENYPVIGKRWMANCEVADLDLLPARYGIDGIRFSAGMELPLIHFGIWALSWLVRVGLPVNLAALSSPLLKLSNLFNAFGSADGGMHVIMRGKDRGGEPITRRWHIVARNGHGPYIPAIPAVVLAKRILDGTLTTTGACPCVGMVSLEEYLAELSHLDVDCFVEATA